MKLQKTVFFFLLCVFLNAQEFSGSVVDNNDFPVAYADVLAKKVSDSTIVNSAMSDNVGRFSINSNGQNIFIEISYLGFKTQIIKPSSKNLGKIVLQTSATKLKTLEVTARKKIVERVEDKLYFNVQEVDFLKGNNGLEILQKSPKLTVIDNQILLKNRPVTILVNGRKVNISGNALASYLSSFDFKQIKRIEIQDMASVDQSADVDNGVVNIVLNRDLRGFNASINSSYSHRKKTFGAYNSGLNLNYGTKKWNIYSNISYTEDLQAGVHNWEAKYDNKKSNKLLSDFEINDKDFTAILGATYSINDKNEIGIENYFNKNKENAITNSSLNSRNHSKLVSRSENLLLENESTKLWYSSISYSYNSDDKTKLSANVEVGEKLSDHSSDTRSIFDDDNNKNSHLLFDSNAKSNYLITKFDFIHKFQKQWKIESGVQNSKTIRENVLNNFKLADNQRIALKYKNQDFDNNETILGFYTSLSKTYKSHFIKLGGRVEYTNIEGKNHINQKNVKKDYTNFFPWVYYKYSINPKNTIYFMAKRSITRPSFKELNPYVIKENDFLFNVGNPNIQPEFKTYSELGYAYKKHYLSFFIRKRDHVIKTRYFHDDDYVTYAIDDNFGKSTETGVDYYYNGYINKWLYLSFSAGLSYNYFKSDDNLITKGISSYNNIFFNVSLPNDWTLSINNSIHPKFYYLNLEIQPQNKFDIEIKKSFLNKKAFISFKCNDVFNTRVDENLSYYKDFTSYYYSKPITRNFILKIQYNIDNNKEVKSSSFENQNNENRGRL